MFSKHMTFRKFVLYFAANIALRHNVPRRYSLSISDGYIWNFCHFTVRLCNVEGIDKFLILERPTLGGLVGFGYSKDDFIPIGKSEGEMSLYFNDENILNPNLCISFSNLDIKSIRINRIYGSQSIEFSSVYLYLLYELLFVHMWRHRYQAYLQKKFQRDFQFSSDRIDILRKIIEWQRELVAKDKNYGSLSAPFSVSQLFSTICTYRVWSLPDHAAYLAELGLVVESLAQSGDLKRENNGLFCVEGKALETLSLFEAEKNRWNSNRKTNIWMVFLTAVLSITAILDFFTSLGD